MRQIRPDQLGALALGCALLGSGGGGDPAYDLLMAKHFIRSPHTLVTLDELCDDALVLPVGLMGAPLVMKEKLQTGREFIAMMEAFGRYYGKRPSAIAAGEIGGANGLVPLIAAFQTGIPLLDGDTIGRAFPQLQMSTAHIAGVKTTPSFFCDVKGNHAILEASGAGELEQMARHLAVAMGSICAVGVYPMTGRQAKGGAIVEGSYGKAIDLGESMLEARKRGSDPVEAIVEISDGLLVATGNIIDIDQRVVNGFLEGSVKIRSLDGEEYIVQYQNEYLVVAAEGEPLVMTPDIIAIVDRETGEPLTSEILRYGLRVAVIGLPSPEIWTTPMGLDLTGPRFFGYPFDYKKFKI